MSVSLSAPATATPTRSEPAFVFPAVALMFILSGASALIYEVVWTRHLTTFFGSTLYGVATVLSAFMGGLALGSYLLGKRADRMRKPLVAYGIFEIGIAIAALVFPYALKATQPLIGAFYATGGEATFYTFSLLRFVIVFALLLVPTTLMGATLPVLSKGVTRDLGRVGRSVGRLYALNTAGAVLGVFAAGFFFLEHFGVSNTTYIAAAVNIAIGALAIAIGRDFLQVDPDAIAHAPEAPQQGPVLSRNTLRLVLLTYAVSGFVALAYQVCWTRALVFSFESLKSTTYSFSAMLVVFLSGLAIGSAIMQSIVDRQTNLLRLYALIQMGIGLFGGVSYFMVINDFDFIMDIAEINLDGSLKYATAVLKVMLRTVIVIGIPTLLMGMAFPVVTRLFVGSLRNLSDNVAKVYALNTVGAIVGSFASGFILIPAFGITGTLALLAAINLTLAAVLFLANSSIEAVQRNVLVVVAALAAVVLPLRIVSSPSRLQRLQQNEKFVHYEEGAMATVSVVENNSGDRMIYVDDVGVAGTDKIMLTDQKSLAHVPMMLLGGEAERVLSVGFGSGGASFSYTLYPEISEIHTIEIAPEVPKAAPTLTASNHGIVVPDAVREEARAAARAQSISEAQMHLTGFRHPIADYNYTPAPGFKTFDPRFRLILDDARSYLRFTDVKYDVIATDCTDLRYKTNANLYDLEYFTLCREAISDRGLVVWMPLAGLSDRAFSSALRTFQEVFPEMGVWYFTNQPTHYCLLIGGRGPVKIDYQAVVEAVKMPHVVQDLDEIGLRDPDKLISSFVCDERTLAASLKDYPLNTEDHPLIEFESPRFGYDSRPLRDNQMKLYQQQVPAGDLLVNLPRDHDPRPRIWELQQANFIVFKGHSEYRLFNFPEAARLYQEALAMVPYDDSIRRLLDFEELRRHFETSLQNPTLNTFWVGHGLASVYVMQDRYSDAVTIAGPLVERISPQAAAEDEELRKAARALNSVLADAYAGAGQEARANAYRKRAEELGS